MTSEYGVKEGQHIPAAVLHRYLTDYSKHFGVFERTRFGVKVNAIELCSNDEWLLHVTSNEGQQRIQAKKIIVATGLTSTPNLPSYPGEDSFTPPFFHAKDFCQRADTVETCKRAVVVGAGKSAFDVAYAFAADGHATVDLVIRPNGQGPVWICPPYVTPLKRKMEELLSTRFLTWMSPCPWQNEDGYVKAHNFLHGSAIGRSIVEKFWNTISNEVIDTHGYKKDAELGKLQPWNSAKWTGSGVGIHNYPTNFFDLVKEKKIRVHIADIEKLQGETVYLTDGESVETDVLICATGWKKASDINFINFDVSLPKSAETIENLSHEADKQVLDMFPGLRDQPELKTEVKPANPLRNYRFIVPSRAVAKRNIAFAGMVSTVTTAIFSTVQGLWISAFFDGKLQRLADSEDEVVDEIMLHTQFEKWRYPCGYGASLPDFAFDSIPYVDLLVNDLGLKCHRKKSYWEELFSAYKPRDYDGLSKEWSDLYGDR